MLRKIAAALVCISWGLWFGGLAALFLFAIQLFSRDRSLALQTAPILFVTFERYQLLLAAAALVGVVGWRIQGGSLRVTFLFALLALAAIPAALSPMLVTSRMEKLRIQGQTNSEEFKKLHGISMMLYTGEIFILLVAGLALPWSLGEKNTAGHQAASEQPIQPV